MLTKRRHWSARTCVIWCPKMHVGLLWLCNAPPATSAKTLSIFSDYLWLWKLLLKTMLVAIWPGSVTCVVIFFVLKLLYHVDILCLLITTSEWNACLQIVLCTLMVVAARTYMCHWATVMRFVMYAPSFLADGKHPDHPLQSKTWLLLGHKT